MKCLSYLSIAALIAVVCCVGRPTSGGDRAIVIGINAYPSVHRSEEHASVSLAGAENDADSIAAMLITGYSFAPGSVQVLKGEQATRARVQAAFEAAALELNDQDLFVFHFSGHGTQVPDRQPLDEQDGQDEALCLYDTTHDGDNLLLDDELSEWLEKLPVGRVTVLLDCCHAGTGTKEADGDLTPRFLLLPAVSKGLPREEAPWRELQTTTKGARPQITAIFACGPAQQAYERRFAHLEAPVKSGQFTQAVLTGLTQNMADRDSNGTITAGELLAYVQQNLNHSFNRFRSKPSDRQDPSMDADNPQTPVIRRRGS